ncbi:uncharacterized protein B0J16DRAFT_329315 [Fusarium flagelliforme]|uniref:uncharacterized protein n=1 Tax=Fusarium flagelliforme TaxID=2675880 RepID=UPI001E8CD6AA|nr:uncharacterized protein B0J16DRAFT_329315 [Fusarium flagelliforme]KAH7197909.1 hypothetical protein B0J16DRAFT_329315 [Fusarium flagelliforme]
MHPLTVILLSLKIATLSCCANFTSAIDIECEVVMQIGDCRPSTRGDMKLYAYRPFQDTARSKVQPEQRSQVEFCHSRGNAA